MLSVQGQDELKLKSAHILNEYPFSCEHKLVNVTLSGYQLGHNKFLKFKIRLELFRSGNK